MKYGDIHDLARALAFAPRNLTHIESLEAIFAAMERASSDPEACIPGYLLIAVQSAKQSFLSANPYAERRKHPRPNVVQHESVVGSDDDRSLNDEARAEERERRRMEARPEDYR